MKISVITVCRNNAAMLARAMDSVLRQRLNGFELEYIVVDGGSSDGTLELLRAYEQKNGGRIKWISESDRGIYDAMNKGIALSTGDLVGIVNSDDAFASDTVLESVSAAFAEDPSLEAVYGDVRFVRDGKVARYVSGRYFRPWMFRLATFPPHPSTFIRRECFVKWGGYDTSYRIAGDFDLLLRFMLLKGMHCRYLPLCTHDMALGGASTTLARQWEKETEDLRAIRANGLWTARPLTWLRYPLKAMEFLR